MEPLVDLKDIKAIIDLMKKNDLSVFEMEKDGFRLKLQKGVGDQPIVSTTMAPTFTPAAGASGPGGVAATPAESAAVDWLETACPASNFENGPRSN